MAKQVARDAEAARRRPADVAGGRAGTRVVAAPVTGYFTPAKIRRVAAIMRAGGIAVLPTDTIYGFHCIVSDPAAAGRIGELKGRGAGKGFILLCADMAMVETVVARWPGDSRRILEREWPAPLTAILPAAKTLRPALRPRNAVAVRIPAHDDLRRLIRLIGEPIVSTSVNRAGEEPMRSIAMIRKRYPFPAVLISRRGSRRRAPSTIVDCTGAACVVVRKGSREEPVATAPARVPTEG
ncbi:MAG: threonylcarbamoyl-AMP synthase [Candidatus Krumholzibacteriota bacterium]|nr:threonylcarbamoyl-AMP synthase [Candidatus Krumholzibacteriota bacterium]